MRFYPPLFFQRVWVKKFHKDFRGVDVKVNHSLLNLNYNSSIFGGTIFSATDPFYAILFDQILQREGFKTITWLKSADIQYIKPAVMDLFFTIEIDEKDVEIAKNNLEKEGKHIACFSLDLYDRKGLLCAKVNHEVYLRNLNFNKKTDLENT